jgi:hypothetical protein
MTVVIRFRSDVNSITCRILYERSISFIFIEISVKDYFVIITPMYFAAFSNESSSGLDAR